MRKTLRERDRLFSMHHETIADAECSIKGLADVTVQIFVVAIKCPF